MHYYEVVIEGVDGKEKYIIEAKSVSKADIIARKNFEDHEILSIKLTKYIDVL